MNNLIKAPLILVCVIMFNGAFACDNYPTCHEDEDHPDYGCMICDSMPAELGE